MPEGMSLDADPAQLSAILFQLGQRVRSFTLSLVENMARTPKDKSTPAGTRRAAKAPAADPRPIIGAARSAEEARKWGVLADPAKDPARAIEELQSLVLGCPHCQGYVAEAMLDAGALEMPPANPLGL